MPSKGICPPNQRHVEECGSFALGSILERFQMALAGGLTLEKSEVVTSLTLIFREVVTMRPLMASFPLGSHLGMCVEYAGFAIYKLNLSSPESLSPVSFLTIDVGHSSWAPRLSVLWFHCFGYG